MSTSETQSMVLLQAMACGVPVVAADTRALPEFVGPANGVLADPRDPMHVARALGGLLASPELRRRLGDGGRQSACNFNVTTITDAWETLYQSVLKGSAAG
jgi:glycosyltransferase involved in cell wall biosynthesis